MSKLPFNNSSPQSVRRAVLKNEREASTYHQFATGQADPVRDRFEEINKSSVTGTIQAQRYPKGADWCVDSVGVEPPLGVAIDQMEPVGEPHETAASLAESQGEGMGPTSSSSGPPCGDALRSLGSLHP